MVEIDPLRKAFVLSYDTDVVLGTTATLKTTNPEGGDVSGRDNFVNDGHVVVTFPADYSGSAECVVTGVDGGEDTGTITV